jgi:phosphatidate cytidylyltransferase
VEIGGSSGADLPHWTEAPTGEVPAVLARESADRLGESGDTWSSIPAPAWREENADWVAHEETFEHSVLAHDEGRLGSLDDSTDTDSQPWSFELPASGQVPAVEVDTPALASEERTGEVLVPSRDDERRVGTVAAGSGFRSEVGGDEAGDAGSERASRVEVPELGDVLTAAGAGEGLTGADGGVPAATGTADASLTRSSRRGAARGRGRGRARDRRDGPLASSLADSTADDTGHEPGEGHDDGEGARWDDGADSVTGVVAPKPARPVPPAPDRPPSRGVKRPPPRPVARPRPGAGLRPPEAPASPHHDRNLPVAVVSGIAFGVVALVLFKLGTVTSMVLVTAVVLLAAVEAFAAFRRAGYHPATLLGLVGTVSLMIATYDRGQTALPIVMVLLLVSTLVWQLARVERGADPVLSAASTVLVFVWVGVFGSFAALLLNPTLFPDRHGIAFLLGGVIAVVAYDVGALAFGRWIGRHPLAPTVSPNKTWQGFFGGAATAVVVSVAVVHFIHPWTVGSAAALGLLVAVVSPLGDLSESLVKRHLGLKDMGRILPGHGGILDRVDGLLFVLPATYYLVKALNLG